MSHIPTVEVPLISGGGGRVSLDVGRVEHGLLLAELGSHLAELHAVVVAVEVVGVAPAAAVVELDTLLGPFVKVPTDKVASAGSNLKAERGSRVWLRS